MSNFTVKFNTNYETLKDLIEAIDGQINSINVEILDIKSDLEGLENANMNDIEEPEVKELAIRSHNLSILSDHFHSIQNAYIEELHKKIN